MKNILIINGWHEFAISKGTFNKSLFNSSKAHFSDAKKYKVQTTEINKGYHELTEVEKFIWADMIIYHTPIWWFAVPFNFKKYLDEDDEGKISYYLQPLSDIHFNGALSGFHGMNRYLGIKLHTSIQFHDVEKNADTAKQLADYSQFLKDNF